MIIKQSLDNIVIKIINEETNLINQTKMKKEVSKSYMKKLMMRKRE